MFVDQAPLQGAALCDPGGWWQCNTFKERAVERKMEKQSSQAIREYNVLVKVWRMPGLFSQLWIMSTLHMEVFRHWTKNFSNLRRWKFRPDHHPVQMDHYSEHPTVFIPCPRPSRTQKICCLGLQSFYLNFLFTVGTDTSKLVLLGGPPLAYRIKYAKLAPRLAMLTKATRMFLMLPSISFT